MIIKINETSTCAKELENSKNENKELNETVKTLNIEVIKLKTNINELERTNRDIQYAIEDKCINS